MKHAVKKTGVFVLCILLGLTVGITSGWLVWNKEPVQPFGPLEYRHLGTLGYVPGDIREKGIENVGRIRNTKDAMEKCDALIEKYCADKLDEDWKEEYDYHVTYAEDMDLWYVLSLHKKPVMGVTPQAVIRGDGEVLDVWIG